MYKFVNPNPRGLLIGDCAVRAAAIACEMTWDEAYTGLCDMGLYLKNMPNADSVWGAFLKSMGFVRHTCPECYSVRAFSEDHPRGTYVLGTGNHVVAVIDGNYCDTWDSGDEIPIVYWREVNL